MISTKQKLVFPILIMSWNPRHYPPAFGNFIASLALELPKEVTWFFPMVMENCNSCFASEPQELIPCSDLASIDH